ncbi:MAG: aminotransferase class IV, partial [Opitutales bacterium]|nr:aminotransferase class IV [Opitutales bacterium]
MKVYLNGEFVPKEQACISVFDHGLLYGDGIFEGIRLYEGCVFKLDQHLERLELSAKAILLDIPISRTELTAAVCETCRQNNL